MRCRASVDLLDTSCDFEPVEDYVIIPLKWHHDHASTHPLFGYEKYLEHTSTKSGVEFYKQL
jgi:hypothetical protein